MERIMLVIGAAATLVAASGEARAEDAPVEVTRSRLPGRIMVDVSVGYGVRQIGSMESATGLALGAEIGRRIGPTWGMVAVLEADAMARDQYISYGVWTVGLGVRWDGPVIVTAGAGLAFGSSKRLLADYTLESNSMSGVTALVHGIVPVATVGHARLGIVGNVSMKLVSDATITTLSAGAAVAW